jgi:hypothetical protein
MGPMQGAFRNQQRRDEEREAKERRKRQQDPEYDKAELVRKMQDDGMTVTQIAHELGMTQRQVRYYAPPKNQDDKND